MKLFANPTRWGTIFSGKCWIFLFVLLLIQSYGYCDAVGDTTIAPKIYIDGYYVDLDYIRTEITFVNYVIDPKTADIHIIITAQRTGGGGYQFTINFIGKNSYASRNDTLICYTSPDDTEDIKRKKIVKTLKVGLLQFITSSPLIDEISIEHKKTKEVVVKTDRWKNWIFSIRFSSYFSGEKSYKSNTFNTYIRAERITEEWKMRFSLQSSLQTDKFKIGQNESTETVISKYERNSLDALVVKSLTNHWSIGLSSEVNSSTFSNIKISYFTAPAVEFNIFPYSESTRRELRLLYRIGYDYRVYHEETFYGKLKEGLVNESLECVLNVVQPWGSIRTEVRGSHYFHDFRRNNLYIFTIFSLRIFRGFEIGISGSFSMIHDQLSLPKVGATREEILLRRRMLETNYNYFAGISLQYTFGSIYSNIVNPRMGR